MDLEERAEHEIELIEQDESLINQERQEQIADVIQILREELSSQEDDCYR